MKFKIGDRVKDKFSSGIVVGFYDDKKVRVKWDEVDFEVLEKESKLQLIEDPNDIIKNIL